MGFSCPGQGVAQKALYMGTNRAVRLELGSGNRSEIPLVARRTERLFDFGRREEEVEAVVVLFVEQRNPRRSHHVFVLAWSVTTTTALQAAGVFSSTASRPMSIPGTGLGDPRPRLAGTSDRSMPVMLRDANAAIGPSDETTIQVAAVSLRRLCQGGQLVGLVRRNDLRIEEDE